MLDDIVEAVRAGVEPDPSQPRACDVVQQAEAGWFVRLTSTALAEQEAPALLASLGVRLRRTLTSDVGAATISGS